MKMKLLALIGSSLVLAACGGQPSGGAAQPANPPVSSAPAAPTETAAPQAASALKSKDGKITIEVAGAFSDKLGDAAMLPENIAADELSLLQHDESSNITIYAIQSGEVADNKAYFDKLTKAINGDKSLQNVKVEPANNKLTYHFSHADASGETTLNESCVVAVQDKQVYNVCASSENADLAALDDIIGKVKIGQ